MEIVVIKAQVDKSALTAFETEVNGLKNTNIKLNVEISGIEKLTNAQARAIVSANNLKIAHEKTRQAAEQRIISENKLATQMEKTATAEEQARTANTKLSTEIQKATTQQEKQNTVIAQTALQAEKTSTAIASLAVQQERAVTAAQTASVALGTNGTYNATPMQQRIDGMVGLSSATKSAVESAVAFQSAWANGGATPTYISQLGNQVGKVNADFSNGSLTVKEYISSLDGMSTASVKATGQTSQLGANFQTFTASVKNADGSLSSHKYSINTATGQVYKLNTGLKEVGTTAEKTGDTIFGAYKKMLLWSAAGTLIYGPIRALKEALQTLQAVDDELVEVRKVTDFDSTQMAALEQRAYKTASAYGASANEYLSSVSSFARAGYKKQSEALAELTTKTEIVGDVNRATAEQFLLSVDAAYKFKGSISDLSKVLDGANELDNKYATSIQKIAEGLGKVAPVAAQANMGIDQLSAAIGTITAVTQRSGTEAATALRALILNIIGDTNTEIQDGETATTDSIKTVTGLLNKYASSAMDAARATGKVVDPMKAIGSMAQAMKEGLLTEKELMDMASELGGKLRTTQLVALIENWDMYKSMLTDFGGAAGSADKEVANAMDSWTRKINILKNTWAEFVNKSVDSNWIKSGITSVTELIQGFDNLGTAVTILGAAIVALNFPKLISSLQTVGAVAQGIPMIFSKAKGGAEGFNAGMKAMNLTLTSTQLLVGAVTAAISIGVIAYNRYKQAQREANDRAIEAGKAAAEEAENIQSVYEAYQQAVDAQDGTTTSKENLASATSDLLELFGGEYDSIDALIEHYGSLGAAIDDVASKSRAEINAAIKVAKEELAEAGSGGFLGNKNVIGTPANTSGASTISLLENAGVISTGNSGWQSYFELPQPKNFQDVLNNYKQLGKVIDYLESSEAGLTNEQLQQNEVYLDAVARQQELQPYVEKYNSLLDAETALTNSATSATDENNQSLADNANQKKSAVTILETLKGKYDILKQAQDDVNNTGYVSASTLDTLLSKYPELSGYLVETSNGYTLTKGALDDFIASQKAEYDVAVTEAENAASSLINQEALKAAGYDTTTMSIHQQIEAMQKLAAANLAMAGADYMKQRLATGDTMSEISRSSTYQDLISAAAKQYNSITDVVENLDSAYQNRDTFNAVSNTLKRPSGAGSSSSNSSSEDKKLAALKNTVELRKSELALLQQQNAPISEQIAKTRQIQAALHNEAEYLRKTKGDQSEINALSKEHLKYSEDIRDITRQQKEERVSLLKSELSLMQSRGESTDGQIAKMVQIQSALQEEEKYLRSINASQTEINALSREYWEISDRINTLLLERADKVVDALDDAERDALEPLNEELEILEAQNDARENAKELEEKKLSIQEKQIAVEKARQALVNAEKERTVRYYNAASGQWEWMADANNVKSAKDALDDAQKNLVDAQNNLADYYENQAYQDAKQTIQRQQERIKEAYDAFRNAWDDAKSAVEDGSMTLSDAYQSMAEKTSDIFNDYSVNLSGALSNLLSAISSASSNVMSASKVTTGTGSGSGSGGHSGGITIDDILDGVGGLGFKPGYDPYDDDDDDDDGGSSSGSGSTSSGSSSGGYSDGFGGYGDPDDYISDWGDSGAPSGADGKKSYDSGGLAHGKGLMRKATDRPESVLDPDLTAKLLTPTSNEVFRQNLERIGAMFGTSSPIASVERPITNNSSTVDQSRTYQYNGIPLSTGMENFSLKQIAQAFQTLSIHPA